MAVHESLTKPAFVVMDGDENIVAKRLEQDIFKRPEVYRTVMTLGGISTLTEAEAPVDGDVIKRVNDYFEYRLDKDVSYDTQTEDALADDDSHRQLIKSMIQAKNPERANQLRDDIRQRRFAFFIDRVITWQAQKPAANNSDLRPSA